MKTLLLIFALSLPIFAQDEAFTVEEMREEIASLRNRIAELEQINIDLVKGNLPRYGRVLESKDKTIKVDVEFVGNEEVNVTTKWLKRVETAGREVWAWVGTDGSLQIMADVGIEATVPEDPAPVEEPVEP